MTKSELIRASLGKIHLSASYFLFREKESKQRKSNERPLQVAHLDTRYLTLPVRLMIEDDCSGTLV
ncbi:MAG: hypothetical protein A3J24_04250 [Deltaproteobacteria bacterium RIFCSPLOWO2_02_FULL_53_8]|nr:MAG: hypothetical protein A3J24_04250 [Deltaproteobacteria bacterium RIFCSPLOWO2_02_FULL_53_8]